MGIYCTFSVLCDDPDMPLHANMSHISSRIIQRAWYHGDTVTYTCDHGYQALSGDLERMCQVNAQWSGMPPTCEGMAIYVLC